MPYHVELRSPLQRACMFNLDDAELWAQVLAPWAAGERLAPRSFSQQSLKIPR